MEPDPQGLSHLIAEQRLEQVGPNRLELDSGPSVLKLILEQLNSPLLWLLIAAAIVSIALGERLDGGAIAAIVVLVAAVGFFQEYRAEVALAALRAMTAPRARVRRDGRIVVIPAAEVVPGDVLVLEAGDVVAADAEVVRSRQLRIDESLLTGESLPVSKVPGELPEDTPLAERTNAVFSGSAVAGGTGIAVVTDTGMNTQMGRIAGMLAEQPESGTPLQRQLAGVGRTLLWLCLGVVAVVAVLGLLRGEPALAVAMVAISLAVAAVPEGLPAMVTVALALGVRRMARRHVLVRRLSAVETLGSATVICTDKTGTLTQGRMAVREVHGDRDAVFRAIAACCDADLASGTGDTMELALLEAARSDGIERSAIEAQDPRVEVEPFDSATRRMWVKRSSGKGSLKGALGAVLDACADPPADANEIQAEWASRGLRVLAVAEGPSIGELTLTGLVGLADPPRPEAKAALLAARRAGIKTVMITGDHPVTARSIAVELGLVQDGDDADELVHARATAEEKFTLVQELRAAGEIVAMTGDGVNDAPAVSEADIGVAMGRAGTEVTRGASDMVLLNDDYASIVAAVREGRGIWDDIRNSLVYLLGGNAGELALMFVTALLGWPVPLLPLQILWINLVTDGLPALALVMEPPADDVLERPPRSPAEPMLGAPQWRRIALIGALDTAVVLAVYAYALSSGSVERAQTLAFTALVSCELLRALAARSSRRTALELGPQGNPWLIGTIVGTLGLQLAVLWFEPTRELMRLVPLSLTELGLVFSVGLIPVSILEIEKLIERAFARAGA